jgi:hypothetical protein
MMISFSLGPLADAAPAESISAANANVAVLGMIAQSRRISFLRLSPSCRPAALTSGESRESNRRAHSY